MTKVVPVKTKDKYCPQWCVKYRMPGWFKLWHTKRTVFTIGSEINPRQKDLWSDFEAAVLFARCLTVDQIYSDIERDNKKIRKFIEQIEKECERTESKRWESE